MAKYFIQDTTLTNIANAIREKTGSTSQLYPENMPGQIRSIMSGSVDTTGIDQGVVDEANRVASSINNKKAANSITFIAMSDMHEMGDSDTDSATILSEYRLANAHAGQGAELIAKQINPDFFANLGDLAWGIKTYTIHDMAQSITNARVKTAGLERLTTCFATPGNHDIGYHAGNFDENLVKAMIGNYKYIDFDSKKVRVIIANTSDISDGTDRVEGVSGEQLQWFSNALDLSGKTDAANWGILIFSHHPLDWNSNTMPLANCIAAYVNGTTYSVTHDGVSISKSYSGKNSAKIIGTFHGHVHCFKVANLSTTTDDNSVKRIAIPNACNGRNNEYGKSGNTTHGEPSADTCPSGSARKSTIAGQDTAFCVVTIDLDEEIIYADCFGSLGDTAPGSHAGYDRTISYGIKEVVTYTITNSITNARNSNLAVSVNENSAYSATIIANPGYKMSSIKVTMGGVDITSTAVSGSNIMIANVTGDIVITATAVMDENPETGTYTNLVTTSLDPKDSTQIYNGNGYKDGYYSNGEKDTAVTGYVSTGGIYMPSGVQAIYVRGCEWDETAYTRYYSSSKETPSVYLSFYIRGDDGGDNNLSDLFTLTRLGDKYFKLTPVSAYAASNYLYTRYYRMTLKGSGADLIITHDQPIPQDATGGGTVTYHTVTNNLTNVTSDNTAASVANGSSYSATLTANAGYTLDTVTVTMGGTDVTSSVYSNGVINISSVTGAIVVTASAIANSTSSYTNQVPISTNYNGSGIFNGTGYMNNYYATTDSPYYKADTQGCCVTGLIPYNSNSPKTIYIKGVGFTTSQSHNRIGFFKNGVCKTTPGVSGLARYFTITTLGTNYYKLVPITSSAMTTWGYDGGIIISAYGDGANMIVTLDEPIE